MKQKNVWQEKVPAGLFAFFLVFGYSFAKTDSWDLVFGNGKRVVASAVLGMVLYWLLVKGIAWLFEWIRCHERKGEPEPFQNRFLSWILDRHPIIGTCLFLLTAWSPYVAAQYPAAMGHDAYSQLNQALGYIKMVAHHPPFHTFWIGFCVKAGRKLGSMNAGIFLYVVTQIALIIAVLAFFMHWLKQCRVGRSMRLAVLLFLGFFPLFPMYATTVLKDVPYSFLFMLYLMLMLEILGCFKDGNRKIWMYLALSSMCGLLLMLLRKNGIYIVLPGSLFLLTAGKRLWASNKRYLLPAVVILFLPIGIFKGYENRILPAMGIGPGSVSEMFSIPFQQTARYARDYGAEVTEEEKEAINKVLDYEYLAKLYNPNLSDPIKDMYRGPSREELITYFKIWFQQFLKHPDVYIQATMNNVYGLFYPGVDNTVIFFDLLEEYGYNNFEQPERLQEYRRNMAEFTEHALKFPGMNVLNNMALWVWVFILEFFFCWKEKRWDVVWCGSLMILSILICVASPVILGHPRYVFPVMLGAMVLLVPCMEKRGGATNE